eukprot:2094987-Prymnesium_polylepis.1
MDTWQVRRVTHTHAKRAHQQLQRNNRTPSAPREYASYGPVPVISAIPRPVPVNSDRWSAHCRCPAHKPKRRNLSTIDERRHLPHSTRSALGVPT